MYVVELTFECFDDTTISAVDLAVNGLMDALRYNGQVLGREFPMVMGDGQFHVRAVCPEKDSLNPMFHSSQVALKVRLLSDASLLSPKVKVLGLDINSEASAPESQCEWQVLYTTYVHTCSPLRCGETLLPIPLYRLPATSNGDHNGIIKWQTEWQACDEIQMARSFKAEYAALAEIQDVDSMLFRKGWEIRGQIESLTHIPTYYYQYRIGGMNVESEIVRKCPKCGGDWLLDSPIHDIFHFKCDDCRIVSNLSWNFQ